MLTVSDEVVRWEIPRTPIVRVDISELRLADSGSAIELKF
jgi:hypothetical protein